MVVVVDGPVADIVELVVDAVFEVVVVEDGPVAEIVQVMVEFKEDLTDAVVGVYIYEVVRCVVECVCTRGSGVYI